MKIYHQYWVYIVRCSDDKFYTGVTNNLTLRIEQHNSGFNTSCFTFCRRPVILVFSQHFTDIKSAISFEKQIKGWSRKKKEALINGDWEEIKRLAKSSSSPPSTSSGWHGAVYKSPFDPSIPQGKFSSGWQGRCTNPPSTSSGWHGAVYKSPFDKLRVTRN